MFGALGEQGFGWGQADQILALVALLLAQDLGYLLAGECLQIQHHRVP